MFVIRKNKITTFLKLVFQRSRYVVIDVFASVISSEKNRTQTEVSLPRIFQLQRDRLESDENAILKTNAGALHYSKEGMNEYAIVVIIHYIKNEVASSLLCIFVVSFVELAYDSFLANLVEKHFLRDP